MKKRIIALDDEPVMSHLLRELIAEDNELEVSEIVAGKEEFLNRVTKIFFDAALIDISVGGGWEDGLEILKNLKEKGIALPSIVLSAHDERSYALKCLQLGAKGYVSKASICSDLINALKKVISGKLFVSGDNGPYILKQYQFNPQSSKNHQSN